MFGQYSSAREHIQALFEERAHDDPNSTTLANTLDTNIQTVFNSPEKFLFELIQNADDAGVDAVDITILTGDGYLIFSHNGKSFDSDDVEAICDNAQQHHQHKQQDINKTGYKGIGFKSVFVIANQVCIISGGYSFRFDKEYQRWQRPSAAGKLFPWQIIPIWTEKTDTPNLVLTQDPVFFRFQLKPGVDVGQALRDVADNPKLLLFLRRVRTITIIQPDATFKLRVVREAGRLTIYVDDKIHSQWLVYKPTIAIWQETQVALQLLGEQECPAKLKRATHTQVTFAAQLDKRKLQPITNSRLYCYLPTEVSADFPFLVNADFLLSADRMQLLKNAWNDFLFFMLGAYHIIWIKQLAQEEQYRDQILSLLHQQLPHYFSDPIRHKYASGVNAMLGKHAVIPSRNAPDVLLKYQQAVVDDTGFYAEFNNIDEEIEKLLTRKELQYATKLPSHLDLDKLLTKIEAYVHNVHIEVHKRLLIYMSKHYTASSYLTSPAQYHWQSDRQGALADRRVLLTRHNTLATPAQVFFTTRADIAIPDFIDIAFIHPDLEALAEVKAWLQAIGVKQVSVKALVNETATFISKHKVNAELSMAIIKFLCAIRATELKDINLKEKFSALLLTCQDGKLRAAKYCYLSSGLSPKLDLQAMVGEGDVFIAKDYLEQPGIEISTLKELLLAIGVDERFSFRMELSYGETHLIDHYQAYRYHLTTVDQVSFFGSRESFTSFVYLPFMRYLGMPAYQTFFWAQLAKQQQIIADKLDNLKLNVRSNRNSQTFDITCYLAFMLSREACVPAQDGSLRRTSELYTIEIIRLLGTEFAELLDHRIPKISDYHLFESRLLHALGFSKTVFIQDLIQLFLALSKLEPRSRLQKTCALYKILCQQAFSPVDLQQLRASNIKLLASDNSLQPVSCFYAIHGDFLVGHIADPRILKYPYDLSPVERDKVCSYFDIPIINTNAVDVECSSPHEEEHMKKQVEDLLYYAAIMMRFDSPNDRQFHYKQSQAKIADLTFIAVDSIDLLLQSKPNVRFATDIYFDGTTIYYQTGSKLATDSLLQMIGDYLGFARDVTDKLIQINQYPQLEREVWLERHGFDINALSIVQDEAFANTLFSSVLPARPLFAGSQQTKVPSVEQEKRVVTDVGKVDLQAVAFSSIEAPVVNAVGNIVEQRSRVQTATVPVPRQSEPKFSRERTPSPQSRIRNEHQWTGAWGEEMVFIKLQDHYKRKYPHATFNLTDTGFNLVGTGLDLSVVWHNRNGESGEPIDFIIIKNGMTRYVEVKTTYQAQEMLLCISRREWALLQQHGNRYRFFCVFNAGNAKEVRIVKIKDPLQRFVSGRLNPVEVKVKFSL